MSELNRLLTRLADESPLSDADMTFGTAAGEFGFLSFSRNRTEQAAGPSHSRASAPRRFLTASLTKPVVGTAVSLLAAEGRLCLTDRIGQYLPEFRSGPFRRATIRHLLTHTSGLPEAFPGNAALRQAHTPGAEYLRLAAECEPLFAPGTGNAYSSVGFLVLGEIAAVTAEMQLAEYLRQEIFRPLGMHETWLGIPQDEADALLPTVLPNELPEWQADSEEWGWNSRYWRCLGAPWGGMISTAADLARYCSWLQRCVGNASSLPVCAAAGRLCFSDQMKWQSDLPDAVRRSRRWTTGFRRQWPDHSASFGDFLSPDAVGHWGASGTLMWTDPNTGRFAVILSTTPYGHSRRTLQKLSNVIASHDHPLDA